MPLRPIAPLLLVMVAVALAAAPAAADLGHPAVHRARRALAEYDLEGNRTVRIIARLGKTLRKIEDPSNRREARFLRAMAAADLVLVAQRRQDEGLHRRVARAVDVSPDALVEALSRELERLSVGVYADSARDARGALALVRSRQQGEEADWTERAGLRSDALFVGAVHRIVAGAEPPTPGLSAIVSDPCAGEAECPEPLQAFGERGRRAVHAVREAHRSIDRLERAARQGDPFPRALAEELTEDRRALAEALLAPAPRVPPEMVAGGAPATAPGVDAGLLMAVQPGEVRYGWVPRVRVPTADEITLVTAEGRSPVLPQTERVRIPQDFRPAVRPIDRLTERLREEAAGGEPTVAFASSADLTAHVLARAIHSAMEAGMRPVMLAGRAPDEVARGVPIDVRDVRRGPKGDPAVQVRVRLGGYTVRIGRRKKKVDRVRDDQGLHFDVAGLGEVVGEGPPATASIDFMTVAAMGPIMKAAYRLAPADGPLQLLIP